MTLFIENFLELIYSPHICKNWVNIQHLIAFLYSKDNQLGSAFCFFKASLCKSNKYNILIENSKQIVAKYMWKNIFLKTLSDIREDWLEWGIDHHHW